MCLITKNQKQIATEDITMYKVLEYWSSPYHYPGIIYEKGVLYETEIKQSIDQSKADSVVIEYMDTLSSEELEVFKSYGQGFHSIRTIDRVLKHQPDGWCQVHECIIPAGAEYIVDETDLVISNKIIVGNVIKK